MNTFLIATDSPSPVLLLIFCDGKKNKTKKKNQRKQRIKNNSNNNDKTQIHRDKQKLFKWLSTDAATGAREKDWGPNPKGLEQVKAATCSSGLHATAT